MTMQKFFVPQSCSFFDFEYKFNHKVRMSYPSMFPTYYRIKHGGKPRTTGCFPFYAPRETKLSVFNIPLPCQNRLEVLVTKFVSISFLLLLGDVFKKKSTYRGYEIPLINTSKILTSPYMFSQRGSIRILNSISLNF